MIKEELLEEIIDELQGSCKSLSEACEMHGIEQEDLSIENLRDLDDKIFNCECCGWWCEISEVAEGDSDRLICTDCGEDYED